MNKPKQLNIALFFTFGIDLQEWKKTGLLNRELAPYKEMTLRGHKVSLITYGTQRDFSFNSQLPDIEIIPIFKNFNKPPRKLVALLYSLYFIFKNKHLWKNFDAIKSNQMWGAWGPLLAAKLSKTRFLARVGYDLYQFNLNRKVSFIKKIIIYLLSKLVYKYSDNILCTSSHTKNFICSNFDINSNKVNFHSNYIDTDLFDNKKRLKHNPRLLFIGRFDTHKNLPLLFKSCQLSDTPLDLIGSGSEEYNLKVLAQNYKIDCNFLGRFPNEQLPSIMKSYSMFALTSKSEGNPKALLEAMSCKLCPIGVNVTGIRDIINEDNGFLVEAVEDELSNILKQIKKDPHIIQEKQEAARKYILENCSLKSMIDLELSIILD